MPALTILIPAAGASSRMRGADKLLQEVEGEPLLHRQARIALAGAQQVIVSLRPDDRARAATVADLPVTVLHLPDAASGLSASLRAGARVAGDALMVLPADMPEITAADLRALIAAVDQHPGCILRGAAANGTPGHPVILPAALFPEILALAGDEGARSILARHADLVRLIALPAAHAITDLDTPEDWAAWRASR